MPQQVKRLLIVFAVLGVGLGLMKYLLVPPTFGKSGHFREAAIDSVRALPIHYAGQSACKECHEEVVTKKAASHHQGVACEVCHGPAQAHTQAPDEVKPTAPRTRGYCPLCHGYTSSRPTGFPQIDPNTHNPAKPCIACHDPHDPVPPHVPEDCGACHGEIARTKAVSPHAPLACVKCHEVPEEHKVNPRSVKPGKPRERAFCGQCHSRDAQSPREIPRVDMDTHGERYVCWQCHYPHHPEAK